MLTRNSFDYAVIRVVPRVEREEFVNAGVIVFCLQRKFLESRVHVDPQRLLALWPSLDMDLVSDHLNAFPKICSGEPDAGPLAKLPVRQRFHWLVAPRSTIIQVSPVHTGTCEDPKQLLDDLFRKLVLFEEREP